MMFIHRWNEYVPKADVITAATRFVRQQSELST